MELFIYKKKQLQMKFPNATRCKTGHCRSYSVSLPQSPITLWLKAAVLQPLPVLGIDLTPSDKTLE